MTVIKICGITSVPLAAAAAGTGADLIGLVFAASRRRVDRTIAKRIGTEVRDIQKVGVFVNAPLHEVREIVRECKLDIVQLHGDEPPEYCREIEVPVIKAVRADPSLQAAALNGHPARWILLDSAAQGQFGGLGIPFDWDDLVRLRADVTKPLLVAGGLNRENVVRAMHLLHPDGVDVSGGVETGGLKDEVKIAEFIRAVREEDAVHAGTDCSP